MTEHEFCITEKTGGSAVSLLSLLGAGRNFFCFGLVFVCVAQTSLSKKDVFIFFYISFLKCTYSSAYSGISE